MAAATTMALVTAGTGLLGSGMQMLSGAKDRKRARQLLANYERQDIGPESNPYRNMKISTLGSDLMREENQRAMGTAFDVLGTAGDRAILGGVGKVIASNNMANRQAQAELDRQVLGREQAIAGGEMNLMGMREARDNQNIAALGSQLNSAQQRYDSGMMGMASSIGAGMRAYQTAKTTEALGELGKNGFGMGSLLGQASQGPMQGAEAETQGGQQSFRFYDYLPPQSGVPTWMNPNSAFNNLYSASGRGGDYTGWRSYISPFDLYR